MSTPSTLVVQWNQLALNAICRTATAPPLAARALAMLHTAMYDAWTVYNPCAISTTTGSLIKRPEVERGSAFKRKAYSFAAYRVLTELFWLALPAPDKMIFHDFMLQLEYDPANTTLDITRPEGIGNLVGKLVLERFRGDGANPYGTLSMPAWSDYTGYQPVNTPDQLMQPGRWQPLKIPDGNGGYKIQHFLTPHWGLVRPFALAHGGAFRPGAPYLPGSNEFQQQADELLAISAGLTDQQKAMAEYWSDGPGTETPPGHWCQVAQYVSGRDNHCNQQDLKLFFALSNAMLDCSIACWECKRYYDSVRPISAIRYLYKGRNIKAWGGPGQGAQEMKGEEWMPFQAADFVTPPFAEHVSGHSTFSKAAAYILAQFTGSDKLGATVLRTKGSSLIEPGYSPASDLQLSWNTFTEAAEQAGMSRLYGGIHFARANKDGQLLGQQVGQAVWELSKYFFNGTL